jgi:hypothetical protein
VIWAIGAVAAGLVAVLAVAAAKDMDRRGRDGQVYAIAVLFVLPVGLLMWALDRRRPVPPDHE